MARTSNRIVKRLLGKVASLVWRIQDFVVENGKVERKTKSNWVRGCEIGLRNLGGSLVGVERLVGRPLPLIAERKLGKVAVVVALPVGALSSARSSSGAPSAETLTSCGRRPWTRRSARKGSGAGRAR